MVTGAAPVVLGRALRLAVAALVTLLPAGFRERQRDEWTADLMTMSQNHWRYVAGAALTLPALRAAARRAGVAGGPAVVASSGAASVVARILILGLGWPVVSWIVAVPVRWYMFQVPDRLRLAATVDPKDMWPDSWLFWLVVPLVVVVTFGAYVALFGGPFLILSVGFAAALVSLTYRMAAMPARHRWALHVCGLALASLLILAGYASMTGDVTMDQGYEIALLGTISVGLGVRGRGLHTATRVTLLCIGLGAAMVFLAHHTDLGLAMQVWFLD